MSAPEFFQTRRGQRFYEATMPKIADQLERLNANLEALLDVSARGVQGGSAAGEQSQRSFAAISRTAGRARS